MCEPTSRLERRVLRRMNRNRIRGIPPSVRIPKTEAKRLVQEPRGTEHYHWHILGIMGCGPDGDELLITRLGVDY